MGITIYLIVIIKNEANRVERLVRHLEIDELLEDIDFSYMDERAKIRNELFDLQITDQEKIQNTRMMVVTLTRVVPADRMQSTLEHLLNGLREDGWIQNHQ